MFLRERYTKILHRRGAYMKEDMKSVIADTFSEMLEKEDIDKITVTRLIAQCHISRQTFYYHFKDIMDVLEWTFRRATQELVEQSLNAKDRLKALTAYITFVRQNRTKLKNSDRRDARGGGDRLSGGTCAEQSPGYRAQR